MEEAYPIGAAFVILGVSFVVFHKWCVDETIKFWKNIHKYSEKETKFLYIVCILVGIVFTLGGILAIIRPDLFT